MMSSTAQELARSIAFTLIEHQDSWLGMDLYRGEPKIYAKMLLAHIEDVILDDFNEGNQNVQE